MARVEIEGIQQTMVSMAEIAAMPESVLDEMLEAAADVVVEEQKKQAKAMGVYDTGIMAASITKGAPKASDDGRKIFVYPKGSRTRYGTKTTNAEIAFINEYGKTGQTARPFIRTANAKAEKKAVEAAEKVYDAYLKSKGLT